CFHFAVDCDDSKGRLVQKAAKPGTSTLADRRLADMLARSVEDHIEPGQLLQLPPTLILTWITDFTKEGRRRYNYHSWNACEIHSQTCFVQNTRLRPFGPFQLALPKLDFFHHALHSQTPRFKSFRNADGTVGRLA